MDTDNGTLTKQMEQLSQDLKMVTSALTNLSSQLKSLTDEKALDQLANKDGTASTQAGTIDDKQNQHTTGYVNWNETHNILKTENWMKVSEFTEFCGKVERGVAPNFSTCITMDVKKVVDQDSRFPEDYLYVNVNSPLVSSEILYIKELQTEKPQVGLVERFLNAAKDEMHSCNSFEKKYGLKWVNPLPNTSNVIEAINDIPVSSLNNVEESTKHSVDTDFCCEVGTREGICLKVTAAPDDVDSHDKLVTQALSNKFTKLLNQLNLRNFDFVLQNVRTLPLDTQKRLDLAANLLIEKSWENPRSSAIYANLAYKLARLSVPSDIYPSSKVTFRALIISACQTNFETEKSDEHLKLEKELAECIDSHKKEELLMKIDESTKIARKRSVANAKFIGELYKLNMLTCKIVDYCLKTLLKELEEDKIECFCELLTTVGEYSEKNDGHTLINYFKQMQDIIDYKSDEISKTSQFMIQDLIELRNRKWVAFKRMANVVTRKKSHGCSRYQ